MWRSSTTTSKAPTEPVPEHQPGLPVADQPVGLVLHADQRPVGHQIVQVGKRLAHREGDLVVVELALEEHRDEVERGPRLGAEIARDVEPFAVMLLEVVEPFEEPVEGPVVRRQHETLPGQMPEPVEALDEMAQRVALGLGEPDADIGGDAGQHLVARDQQLEFGAVERGVLRGVPAADDHLPIAAADLEPAVVPDPPHARRHRRRPAAEIPHPGAIGIDAVVVEPVDPEELHPGLDIVGDVLRPGEMGLQPFAVGHPQRRAELVLQPPGEAEMVGVEMGDDGALDRTPAEPLDRVEPVRLHVVAVPTGVDHGPAVAVLDQIEVDVVEREGERHLEPEDAGRDLQGLAVFEVFMGVTRLAWHGLLRRLGSAGKGNACANYISWV